MGGDLRKARQRTSFSSCWMETFSWRQGSAPETDPTVQIKFQITPVMDQFKHYPVRACSIGAVLRYALVCGWFVSASVPIATADSMQAAQQKAQAQFNLVIQTVQDHFASVTDYQPRDLITQSQVEKVLEQLGDAGVEIRDRERISQLAVPDDSFLAKQFSTPAGRAFMRKIARHPGAYSQVDRLSTIPRGQRIVRDLIHQRGGDQFVEYLTTTKGGRNLGGMLAGAHHGVDLNKPTGRIYTVNDLVAELRRVLTQSNQN
jgi:hypothetical protein